MQGKERLKPHARSTWGTVRSHHRSHQLGDRRCCKPVALLSWGDAVGDGQPPCKARDGVKQVQRWRSALCFQRNLSPEADVMVGAMSLLRDRFSVLAGTA